MNGKQVSFGGLKHRFVPTAYGGLVMGRLLEGKGIFRRATLVIGCDDLSHPAYLINSIDPTTITPTNRTKFVAQKP